MTQTLQFSMKNTAQFLKYKSLRSCILWAYIHALRATISSFHYYTLHKIRKRVCLALPCPALSSLAIFFVRHWFFSHFRPNRLGRYELMPWRGRPPAERNHHRCSFKRVGHTRAIHCWRSFRTITTGLLCRQPFPLSTALPRS